jgi:hypothetical protein
MLMMGTTAFQVVVLEVAVMVEAVVVCASAVMGGEGHVGNGNRWRV